MATKPVSPLQALIVADSFDEYFRPITLEKPRALLPIAGIPLLNYTIEFLASSGVREIFVLCRAHADAIEAHVTSFKGKIGVDVKTMKVPRSQNMGDALREMANTDHIAQDFVLVYGDIVSNQKLLPILQDHVLRREKDKNVLMTLLLTKAQEDQELSKLKIPLLNTLFTGSNAQAAAISAAPSATVTPHVSSMLPIDASNDATNDSLMAGTEIGISPASSSHMVARSTRTASISTGPTPISSSPGASSFMESEKPSLLSSSVATGSSSAPRLGESSVYLTLSSNESKFVIMDSETGQLFLYDDRSSTHSSPHVELDTALFRKHKHILVRNDLQDSGVAICSSDVLIKFQDHFDYKNLSQLVRGVINDELQELKVYAAIADDHYYTNRVSSLRRYHQVTNDILRRWAYPLVPDTNILPDSTWTYSRPGIYKEQHVHLHRDCVVNSNCAIGERSALGSGTVVAHSTIGRNCKVGRNVKISHSFIWDNVVIEDDVTLDHAIVCSGARIGASTQVASGCIIGYHVIVGSGISLAPLTKLTSFGIVDGFVQSSQKSNKSNANDYDDFGDDYGSSSDDTNDMGELDSDDYDTASDGEDGTKSGDSERKSSTRKRGRSSLMENLKPMDLGAGGLGRRWNLPPLPFNELSTGWETVQHIRDVLASMQRMRGANSAGGQSGQVGQGANEQEPVTDMEAFTREVESIVSTYCKDSKKEMKQLVLEVNALKFAHDRSFLDCIIAIFDTLLQQSDKTSLLKALLTLLKRFKPVFPAFLFSTEDETELIFHIEEICDQPGNEDYAAQFTNILNKLYELEVIKEQAFLDWADEHAEDDDEEESKLFASAKTFIDWLREEDDEDEEDEEDDDE